MNIRYQKPRKEEYTFVDEFEIFHLPPTSCHKQYNQKFSLKLRQDLPYANSVQANSS